MQKIKIKRRLSSFQTIILGFLALILVGTFLLMLPFSSRGEGSASFADALFTATSATCVTGLIVQDTATYWSAFGQAVILTLIQIGGLGVITVTILLISLSKRKIGLGQRSTMQEAISAPSVGGIIRMTKFILKTTVAVELLGAVAMAPIFIRDFGAKGIWYAVFHSVSCFCNAGFDLMGVREQYSSVTSYYDNPVINITLMLLILTGAIGFLTWEDVREHGIHIKKYRMQSKMVLAVTVVLTVIPALYYFFFEFSDPQWELSLGQRILVSLFQTVTPRTAGFNTVDLAKMTGTGQALMIILMIIGGSSGSTAGGLKTTTVGVLFAATVSVFRRDDENALFGRRISNERVRHASALLLMYMSLFMFGGMAISRIENLPLSICLFESASAIATVGLTLGITPGLSMLSRGILVVFMFLGRVGGLTFLYAAVSTKQGKLSQLPKENINVG